MRGESRSRVVGGKGRGTVFGRAPIAAAGARRIRGSDLIAAAGGHWDRHSKIGDSAGGGWLGAARNRGTTQARQL